MCRNTENKGHKRKRNPKMDMCYVNKKNPHSMVEVFPNRMWIMLSTKKMFTHVYDISGPHSYQQITVYTIFQ